MIIKSCPYYNELASVLTKECNLSISIKDIDEIGTTEIEISGEVQREDIRKSSEILAPQMTELIDIKNGFSKGILGVMELITLVEINNDVRSKRRGRFS